MRAASGRRAGNRTAAVTSRHKAISHRRPAGATRTAADDKDAERGDDDRARDNEDVTDDERDDDERVGDKGDETEVGRGDPLLYEVADAELFAGMTPPRGITTAPTPES